MTVLQALQSRLARSAGQSGACHDSPEALQALNDARQMIYMEDEDYVDTTSWARVNVHNGVFWCPAHLQAIRSAYSLCGKPAPVGGWYSILSHSAARLCACDGIVRVGATGMYDLIPNRESMRNEIVSFTPNNDKDHGVVISIVYVNAEGAQLTEEITLGPDPAATQEPLRMVVSVSKPPTIGGVTVRMGDEEDAHTIQPWEVEPKYERFIARGKSHLVLFGRKKFRELGFNEPLDITNLMALEAAMRAQAFRDDQGKFINEVQLMQRFMQKADSHLMSDDQAGAILDWPTSFAEK